MKRYALLLLIWITFNSCEFSKPAYRYSNFYGTPAENIVRAIEDDNVKIIRDEIRSDKVSIDFEDKKYEVSLLSLSLYHNKKKSFDELLKWELILT